MRQESFVGNLSYDVDETPEGRKLLEQTVLQELEQARRSLAEKFLSGKHPDMEAYASQMMEIEQLAREKMKRATADAGVIHFFESGFPFEQTFNQGQFESVEELIKKMEK